MQTQYEKKDDSTLVVTTVVPEQVIPETELPSVEYDYDALLKQKESLQAHWDDELRLLTEKVAAINVERQTDMDEVDALIAKAKELGITSKEVVP